MEISNKILSIRNFLTDIRLNETNTFKKSAKPYLLFKKTSDVIGE
jgi:hypothetical protein